MDLDCETGLSVPNGFVYRRVPGELCVGKHKTDCVRGSPGDDPGR
jgi:hypothetical protein